MSSIEATQETNGSPKYGTIGDGKPFRVELISTTTKTTPILVQDRWKAHRHVLHFEEGTYTIGDSFRINRINVDSIRIQWLTGTKAAEYLTVKTSRPNTFTHYDKKRVLKVEGMVDAYCIMDDSRIPLIKSTWKPVITDA